MNASIRQLMLSSPIQPAVPAPSTPAATWLILALLAVTGCQRRDPDVLQGYIEGEYVRVAAPVGGTLVRCAVTRGSLVKSGDLLFVLESAAEQAALDEAGRRVNQAEARLENLRKGRRPSEIATLEARVEQARANLGLLENELSRREKLIRDHVIAATELDQARSQRDANRAFLEAATSELATARLGARDDEIHAAEADLAGAQAARERNRWNLDQKTQKAPADAVVHDSLFHAGEFVAAGQPVVSLLPPSNLKIRFFAPQPRLDALRPGTIVEAHVDGVPQPIPATVSYIATQPEFTPPVIYSRDQRSRLVYLVEASVPQEAATRLHPGQPVDVRINAATPPKP